MIIIKNFLPKKIFFVYFIFFAFTFKPSLIKGQTKFQNRNYYNSFDSIVGLNNIGIYEGILYQDKYRGKDGNHKFYKDTDFIKGEIIYKNLPFYNIEMKYDLFNDIIIVHPPSQSQFYAIQLPNEKIDEFIIEKHHFIKITGKFEMFFNKYTSGFYEFLYKNDRLKLFKKNRKIRKERTGEYFGYSVFLDKNEYLIKKEDEYYKIKSKKYLIKLFPNLKKEIKHFYSSNKHLLKSDKDTFMINLIKHISHLIIDSQTAP